MIASQTLEQPRPNPRPRPSRARIDELEDVIRCMAMQFDALAVAARVALAMGDERVTRMELEWIDRDGTRLADYCRAAADASGVRWTTATVTT